MCWYVSSDFFLYQPCVLCSLLIFIRQILSNFVRLGLIFSFCHMERDIEYCFPFFYIIVFKILVLWQPWFGLPLTVNSTDRQASLITDLLTHYYYYYMCLCFNGNELHIALMMIQWKYEGNVKCITEKNFVYKCMQHRLQSFSFVCEMLVSSCEIADKHLPQRRRTLIETKAYI